MKGYRLPSLLAACLLAALCAGPSAPRGRGGEPAPPEQDAERLARDLGSKSFAVREAATRRLLEYEVPPAAQRAALKSDDAEVARRAARIVEEISRRGEKAASDKFTEFARRGEIDRLADLFGRRPRWEDEGACWQAVEDLAGRLVGLEREKYGLSAFSGPRTPVAGLYRHYAQMARDRSVPVRIFCAGVIVRAERISQKGATQALLVSSRDTKVGSLFASLVLAGGPVEVGGMCDKTIIVCDGGLKCRSGADGCLILARGDVEFSGVVVAGCRVITAGSVRFAPGTKRRGKVEVHEHEPNPLGFVRWFDPARVGVTVGPAEGGVRVKAAGKSFAAAGLRAGDLLTAIDGEAVKSPDEFRLLLRSKLADGGKMALAVRRAGKDLTIPVRCKD